MTPRQKQLFDFISTRITETGVSPSFDEMREAMGLASKSGVVRIINALTDMGKLRRFPYRARALELVEAAPAPVSEGLLSIVSTAALRAELARREAAHG